MRRSLFEADDHFLSPYNPLVTVDQWEVEQRALKLFSHPVMEKARKIVAQRWRTLVGRDMTAEAEVRFDELVEEFSFAYLLQTVNGDPNYPKVTSGVYGPAHRWMGLDVLGSRASGGDGPDQTYSFIPVDYGSRFEIHGQRFEPGVSDTPYMLSGDFSFNMTLSMLQGYDLDIDRDGKFVITVGPDPANGRRNHIQTQPNARFIFIRECRNDWRQVPAKHRVVRLDSPNWRPLSDDEIVVQALHNMSDAVPRIFWFMRIFRGMDANIITEPFHTGDVFGMVSQAISFARIDLDEDYAFIIDIGHGGAAFRDIVLHDYWFRTLQYWNITSSMNPSQEAPNPDGKSTTFVVSLRDPGVQNWLDPGGFHEVLLVNRWQALPLNSPLGSPASRGRWVKFADLDHELPTRTVRLSPAERQAQRKARTETFLLRYQE